MKIKLSFSGICCKITNLTQLRFEKEWKNHNSHWNEDTLLKNWNWQLKKEIRALQQVGIDVKKFNTISPNNDSIAAPCEHAADCGGCKT